MRRKTRVFLKTVCCFVLIVLVFALSLYAAAYILGEKRFKSDLEEQRERIAALRRSPGAPVDEQTFADFDLDAVNPKINRIRTLITHNSYKKKVPDEVYNFFKFFAGEKALTSLYYAHNTLTDQLNNGVRGVELDIRYQNEKFNVYHIPLRDNGSTAPDWELALEELKIWSDNNPDHVPVSVLVEYKDDGFLYNPTLKKATPDAFLCFDQSIAKIMGDKLFAPRDFMGEYQTVKEALENDNWPTYSEAKGKFVFLFHDGAYTDMYINRDKALKTQSAFPIVDIEDYDTYAEYIAYVKSNDPATLSIQGAVANNLIVRTRMDAGMEIDAKRKALALESNAQLISTDFEKGIVLPVTDYVAYLREQYTILLLN